MKHFRYVYIIANALVIAFFGLYVMEQHEQSFKDVEKELLGKNEIIAAGSRTSLLGLETMMRQVGNNLMTMQALNHPERGASYIQNLEDGHPKVFGYALSRADGQAVVITGIPVGGKMPNFLKRPQSAKSFQRALNSNGLQIGSPYSQDFDQDGISHWIIPARLAIRDKLGAAIAVISTALEITAEGTIWHQLSQHHKKIRDAEELNWKPDFSQNLHSYSSVSFVIHGDGYVQYAGCGLTRPDNLTKIFSDPVSPELMSNLQKHHRNSAVSIWQSKDINQYACHADNQDYITVSEYVPDFDIYVLTVLPLVNWETAFFKSITPQFITCLLLFAIAYATYRYTNYKLHGYEEQVTYLARYDALTKLPNKNQLLDRTTSLVAVAHHSDHLSTLIVISISNLSLINQTRGLKFGEQCIKEIAQLYKKNMDRGDVLARIGAETFALFLPSIKDEQQALSAVKRAQATLKTPLKIYDEDIFLTGKIGYALCPTDAKNGEELFNAATLACDTAKKEPNNTLMRYTPQIDTGASRHAKLSHELIHALDNNEIEVYYQPKIDAQTGTCSHFEALARWHSTSFGMVGPDEFIAIAEEIGIIDKLGLHVLNLALDDMNYLQGITGQDMHIAVNVSTKQFLNPNLPQQISEALLRHDFPGERLTLELTESLMIIDKDQVASMLAAVREMGIGISIDDFGTGYSSLSYIHKLPVTELKIDRSFITDIIHDEDNKTLVQSIIALGKSLKVQTVAEGIETPEHVELLKNFGCHYLQGYYYSPPRPIEDIVRYIQKS